MINLIPAELRRQLGRRGSIYGSLAFNSVFAIGVLIWAIVSSKATGAKAIDSGTGLLLFSLVISAIVIGATAGSYDVDQGTMRYLVLTGRPRWQLALVRVPALFVTVIAVSLPAILLILVATVVAGGPSPEGHAYVDLTYSVWVGALSYALLSLAIGMFLKSNGVAIAVSVVLNFAGLLIAGVVFEYVSEALGKAMFPIVVGTVLQRHGDSDTYTFIASLAILGVWLVALLGAATLRIQRAEY